MPRLSKDKKEQIQRAFKDGKTPTQISKMLGVARTSIYRVTQTPSKKRNTIEEDDATVSSASGSDSEGGNDVSDEDNNPSIVKKFLKMSTVFADELGLEETKPTPEDDDRKPPHLVIQEERQASDAKANFMRMMMDSDRPQMEVPDVAQLREQIRLHGGGSDA